ncbi:MAG: phosphoadenylyl-sulfate reductase [Actinobacteria bacterium]|nr:phosphoadenylyl-sulfate reductase [Actinomycetota bacterium]|tara:strand:- start:1055 stop:1789 length:735 start_codon:yes stop_codon:yes gene_type:complete
MKEKITQYQQAFSQKNELDLLKYFVGNYKIKLASSLGAEDQVLTHMLAQLGGDVQIFVLDTGRLHPETYTVLDESAKKYQLKYEIICPDRDKVEAMVQSKGINLFYDSIENRKECCGLRKVEGLKRALSTCEGWITGQRKAQSVTRSELQQIEWDHAHQVIKLNPLADWTQDQVWDYIRQNEVPYNALHDQGFLSIGCAPCTRAIKDGEDPRSGRWWWETPEQKECGLHIEGGQVKRTNNGSTR